ncbi:helix-turn-helix domain-containing protein [Mesorhizobium sp. KR9-304]|uniref:helix-turn-helix domain-containing protein n=1 Tax=Mesorhizobium sp. KR9-304 TaxID=3156614 RepID=UPI0032B450F4
MTEEATIRRGPRNARYTTVPNHVFEDTKLSMEARWLLGYLLSKPDGWIVRLSDIRKKGGCGRDKARAMVAELVDERYAEREEARKDGKFNGLSLVIYDEPRAQEVSAEGADVEGENTTVASLPQTEKPATVKPATVNPPLVKTEDLATPESSIERDAREAEDPKKIEAEGWALLKNWPGFDGMPKEPAMAIWRTQSPEDRAAMRRRFLPWLELLRRQKKSHIPAPSTFMRERLWEAVPDPAEAPAPPAVAPPFGKLFGARRMALLLAGPGALPRPSAFIAGLIAAGGEAGERERLAHQATHGWPEVNRMHDSAAVRRGVTIAPVDEPAAAAVALMEAVSVGSGLWDAWKVEHERRGWPWLPDPGALQWVQFPAGGPDGLGVFEMALRGETKANEGNHDDAGRPEAAE